MKKKDVQNFVSAESFSLPRYQEIPNVGLYLKQVVKLINDSLEPMFHITVTETMLSNYVKKHLVSSPVRKQYDREQIAALMFIVLAKTVLSLDDIQLFLNMQAKSFETAIAYDYFCCEFENILKYVYGCKDTIETIGTQDYPEKELLRSGISAMVQCFYLEECFRNIRREFEEEE